MPTPKPSNKVSTEADNKANEESKEKQPVTKPDIAISEKDNPEIKENPKS